MNESGFEQACWTNLALSRPNNGAADGTVLIQTPESSMNDFGVE